jgi:hypothetical protein
MLMLITNSLIGYAVILASTALIIWSLRNKGEGTVFGKIVGSLIFLVTLLSILCINYIGYKKWKFVSEHKPEMEIGQEIMKAVVPIIVDKLQERREQRKMENQQNPSAQ